MPETLAVIFNKYCLKKVIFFSVLILAAWGLYMVSQSLNGIAQTDFVYNTIYSDNFRESIFNESLIGKSKNQIFEILGRPFSETNLSFF
jgi:hypothetical protein